MRLVVDAGVAVKWLVAEEGSDAADRLLTNGDDLICAASDGVENRQRAVAQGSAGRD